MWALTWFIWSHVTKASRYVSFVVRGCRFQGCGYVTFLDATGTGKSIFTTDGATPVTRIGTADQQKKPSK